MKLEIDKTYGSWDAVNPSMMDDLAYYHYCKVTCDIFINNIRPDIFIPQHDFVVNYNTGSLALRCFYRIAKQELRSLKINKLKNEIK
jgi:hypothetical protein